MHVHVHDGAGAHREGMGGEKWRRDRRDRAHPQEEEDELRIAEIVGGGSGGSQQRRDAGGPWIENARRRARLVDPFGPVPPLETLCIRLLQRYVTRM